MPQGDKSAYSNKQKRQAEHIEEGYKKEGVSTKEAERRAWATVNDRTGGGKKSGSGRKKASRGKAKSARKRSSTSRAKSTRKRSSTSRAKSTRKRTSSSRAKKSSSR